MMIDGKIDLTDLPRNFHEQVDVIAELIGQIDGPPCCSDPACAIDRLAAALDEWSSNLRTNAAELRVMATARRAAMRRAGGRP